MSNIQPYIIINGVNSRTISGLLITSLPPISKPQVRTQVETVDGRSGDIVTPLGYAAYDKPIKIGLTRNYDIDEVIEFFNTSGTVIFSNEPTKYYRFAIYEQIDFEKLIRFKTAEVVLHVQPYKFSTTEEPLLFNDPTEISVENNGNTDARPNLLITGSGEIDVSLNGSQLLSMDLGEDDQTVIIDSENMNAYGAQSAIREVVADIEPKQAGSGDPSPDNIREISGFTEANIVNTQIEEIRELFTIDTSFRGRVNFNQLAKQLSTENGYFFDNASGNINDGIANITANRSQARVVNHTLLDYKKGHKYFVSLNCEFSRVTIIQFQLSLGGSLYLLKDLGVANQTAKKLSGIVTDNRGEDGTHWGGFSFIQAQSGDTGKMGEFQIIDLTQLFGEAIADYIYNLEQSQAGAGVEFFKAIYPQEYYPYNAGQDKIVGDITPVTVNLGQTVYGGKLNVITGELTITHKATTIDDLSFYYDSVNTRFITTISDIKSAGIRLTPFITSVFYSVDDGRGYADVPDNSIYSSTNTTTYIKCLSYTDSVAFKTAFTGVKIVYPIAEPYTVQLTPTQINNLLGLNNLFSDTGDLSVKYKSGGVIQTQTGDIVTFTVGVGDMDKGTLLNRLITGNYDKIRLKKGENVISFTGNVKQVSIDKYSRWI